MIDVRQEYAAAIVFCQLFIFILFSVFLFLLLTNQNTSVIMLIVFNVELNFFSAPEKVKLG